MRRVACLPILFLIVLVTGCASPAPAVSPGGASTPILQATPTILSPTDTEEPTAQTTTQPAATETVSVPADEPKGLESRIAYLGKDGNLWMIDFSSGEQRQVTMNAVPYSIETAGEVVTVSYCCAKWSSDGRFLAFWQDTGTPVESGYDLGHKLQVIDLDTGESIDLLDQTMGSFDWKPDMHEIAFDLPIDDEYFVGDRENHATGIQTIDVETGSRAELVPPENGYAIAGPRWARTGEILTFQEILYMEGSGQFAYYDFAAEAYVSTGEVIGSYSLSPDRQTIAFDRLSYAPSGEERIWIRDLEGDTETQISPDFEDGGYAFGPQFSPDGKRLAYFAVLGGPESHQMTLYVFNLDTGETAELGEFDEAGSLQWSPDGGNLALVTGPFEDRQIIVVDAASGAASPLVQGSEPAWQPVE